MSNTPQDLHAKITVTRDDFDLTVELDLRSGVTTALLGPNGSGKSTLVEALAGIISADSGRISLGDRVLGDRVLDEPGANTCLLYTSPSPRDRQKSRMPSSA